MLLAVLFSISILFPSRFSKIVIEPFQDQLHTTRAKRAIFLIAPAKVLGWNLIGYA